MDQIDAATFNNLFISRLDTHDGLEKAAQAGGAFVRERLREVSTTTRWSRSWTSSRSPTRLR